MPISTSDGKQYDDEFSFWHAQLFGEPQQEQPKEDSKLYLVRHGDTALNEQGSEQSKDQPIRGWSPVPLNDDGIKQAHEASEALKDKDITRIVSSDLPRAKQTANIISKNLNVPVTFDPNLRTWDMGDYDGSADPAHREAVNKYATVPGPQAQLQKKSYEDYAYPPSKYPGNINSPGGKDAQPRDHFDYIQEPNETDEQFNKRLEKELTPEELDYFNKNWYEYAPVQGGGMGWKVHEKKVSSNEPNQDTPPPGSSESFNDFKSRIINTVAGYSANNEGHNTAIITHHSPERVFSAWEHAGYPEDGSIHMPTYQEEGAKPGKNISIEIPEHVERMFGALPYLENNEDAMDRVRTRAARQVAGGVVHGSRLQYIGRNQGPTESPDIDFLPERMPGSDLGFNEFNADRFTPIGMNDDILGLNRQLQEAGANAGAGSAPVLRGSQNPNTRNAIIATNKGNTYAKINIDHMRDDMERLFKEGKSINEVADELNITKDLVKARKSEWGLQARIRAPAWNTENTEILKQRLKEGKSFQAIADELGISRSSVGGRAARLKIIENRNKE